MYSKIDFQKHEVFVSAASKKITTEKGQRQETRRTINEFRQWVKKGKRCKSFERRKNSARHNNNESSIEKSESRFVSGGRRIMKVT